MKQRLLSQEALKLIACVTMLIDHFGAVIVPCLTVPYMVELYYVCRAIGRIAFPIYAFLLAEGMHHTRNPKKYILRLAAGILLAEFVFDMVLFGGITWENQNVMLTLTLGAVMLLCAGKVQNRELKYLLALPFAFLAELLCCDYGAWGILTIAVFYFVDRLPMQLLCIAAINWLIPSLEIPVFGLNISIQLFAVLAMAPIALYSGEKLTHNRAVQLGFYLFYPLHLLILWLILGFMR